MKMTNRKNIEQVLWNACDSFRGKIDSSRYKDYILSMLFVKYLSDVSKERREEYIKQYDGDMRRVERAMSRERFAMDEQSTFDYLYANRNDAEIGQKINVALNHIEEHNSGKLRNVFRAIDFNSQVDFGEPKEKNATLRNLLEDFNGLDLRPSQLGSADIIGDAYEYMIEKDVDLFADHAAFDGKHGIMAYNRTLQQAGKAHQVKPMEEWIVSVGKHKGVITGKKWIQVQNLLEVNKSKSYRKPRSNVALLSGLLFCKNCGEYMRPKLSSRVNANGETIYTYLCTTKERSRGHCCSMKNANGNMLDAKLMAVLADLSKNNSDMFRQLDQGKKVLGGNCEGYEAVSYTHLTLPTT